MALYTPDYDYQNGKKFLEELKTPQANLIRYYVKKQDDYIEKLQKRIDEMQNVFDGIKKYVR